jgi:hypothetical protein
LAALYLHDLLHGLLGLHGLHDLLHDLHHGLLHNLLHGLLPLLSSKLDLWVVQGQGRRRRNLRRLNTDRRDFHKSIIPCLPSVCE